MHLRHNALNPGSFAAYTLDGSGFYGYAHYQTDGTYTVRRADETWRYGLPTKRAAVDALYFGL